MSPLTSQPPAPPHAKRLSFQANAFTYSGKTYFFKNVRHVEFRYATRRQTQRDGQVQKEFSSLLRVGMADGSWVGIRLIRLMAAQQKTLRSEWHQAMVQAAETLSARTFNARMDALMGDVKRLKYFRQGQHQITTQGDLFRSHAYCFNVCRDEVNNILFTDHMVCSRKPKRWWKRLLWSFVHDGERIDLTRDRDCFLYFLRFYTGLYWPQEPMRLWHGRAADGKMGSEVPPKADQPREEAREEPQQEVPVPPKPVATSVQHLATLGLMNDATWEEVRQAYRRLAREYHPDLMRGRGASVEAMSKAEDVLKDINRAYGWLEDFYRLKPKT